MERHLANVASLNFNVGCDSVIGQLSGIVKVFLTSF